MKSSTLNLVNDVISAASEKGIIQLATEDTFYDGRNITVKSNKMLHFGSCSYLGLELDDRLKQSAIDAIERYGIQFSSSRSYLTCTLYTELDRLLRRVFDAPVALATSVSLGHHGVLPVIIGENDAIIMDQQVHASVQDAALKMQAKGVSVSIIRHNDLDELKKRVEELSLTHSKIWYLIDGIYSMYGDFAPVGKIVALLDKYKKLHLYADDAHGMSWYGTNGKGYVLTEAGKHSKIVVATSLNKAFAAGGGAFIFPNEEMCQKVKNVGGPFMFSGPHQIPVIAAAIASARIHLSEEIYAKQQELAKKINYCHSLLKSYKLPVVSSPQTPIFFIGLGLLRVGHNMVNRMISEGLFVNIGMFPAVPESCTGIRFTITLHHTYEDIKRLVDAIAFHLPKALAEEERSIFDIHRAFKRVTNFEEAEKDNYAISKDNYTLIQEKTIRRIPKKLWNDLMGGRGNFDWDSLVILEKAYSNNADPENNWKFHYYLICDSLKRPILATFFTITLSKDDMLAPKSVSHSVEELRKKDQYFLTSKSMMMGSLVTEGNHLYLDRNFHDWKKALMMLIDAAWKEQDRNNASVILMRDFDQADKEISTFFKEQGFIMFELPDAHFISENSWENKEAFLNRFAADKKYYLRKRVFAFEDQFNVKITSNPTHWEIERLYELYLNIARKNLEINVFIIPKKLFEEMAKSGRYEFILLFLKNDLCMAGNPVGMAVNYKTKDLYCFLFTGLDYSVSESYNVYPQILWQVVSRANQLNVPNVTLGYTASQNKRKFAARAVGKLAFIQMKDNFNMNLIEIMGKTTLTVK